MTLPTTNGSELSQKADQYMAYETEEVITWCGGCGNFAIQNALRRALVLEGFAPDEVLMCFDIGCSGNGSDKIEGYTIHGLHGRVLPLAAGAVIANPKMKVIASAGDGATLNEGVNHLIHAIRSDYPILFLHHDNQNFALTTGQASCTTPQGCKANSAPDGAPEESINPLSLVLSQDPSFVARTISSDTDHMTEIFRKALHHKGFAFIEILQTCPTYNKHMTDPWLLEQAKEVRELPDYDAQDIWAARKIVEIAEPIHTGILYHNRDRKNFLEVMKHRDEVQTTPVEEVRPYDLSDVLEAL